MTADWRATLERVAELLAEATTSPFARAARVMDARNLIRGLLAEPQVNPSEAKDWDAAIESVTHDLMDQQVEVILSFAPKAREEYLGYLRDRVRLALVRAGLLAEGEENRKP